MLKIQIDPNRRQSLVRLCDTLFGIVKAKVEERGICNLAISGGDTAAEMFEVLLEYKDIDWSKTRFFWVDERCVPPRDSQSNYAQALKRFFIPAKVPAENIFRLRGEECPVLECQRYSRLVQLCVVDNVNGTPSFDCAILGVGKDSHTASIFPETMNLLTDTRLYAVSFNPATRLWRMTMTSRPILAAAKLLVPIYGVEKEKMLKKLLRDIGSLSDSTPASYILSRAKFAEIFTDIKAI